MKSGKPRRYFRKRQVADRYGYVTTRSIDRAWLEGRFPAPTLYQSRRPLWAEDTLDKWDKQRAKNLMADRAAHSPKPPPAPPRGHRGLRKASRPTVSA